MSVWDDIYLSDSWGGGSGPGSKPETTQEYRAFVEEYIKLNDVRSVLDFGCGDGLVASMMRFDGVLQYVGVDASDVALELARKRNAGRGFTFINPPPDVQFSHYDLALVKDVFQHLPHAKIHSVMQRLRNCRHVLITNDIPRDDDKNDISEGQWRPIDLRSLGYTCAVLKEFDSAPLRKRVLLLMNR